MKSSIVLIEVILSIALFSIIALVSTKTIFSLYKKNTTNQAYTSTNITLETTRLYLIKNNDFTKIKFEDQNLYFDGYLLLHKVLSYEQSVSNGINSINICIDTKIKQKICQTWKIPI